MMESADSTPDSVFTADQFEHNVPDGVQFHYWHRARNRIVERRLAALGLAPDALILEIGCGRGVVVDHLRRRGYCVKGCELGEPAPLTAEVASHLMLSQDALALPRGLSDEVRVVLLLDVLEHLEDPAAFLASCREAFPGLEHVVVTLPARQELFSNYDDYYGHHLRYDIPALCELAGRGGARVVDVGYFFHALYAPVRLLGLLSRRRAVVMQAPSRALGGIHALLGRVFEWEQRLMPRRWAGTSLYAVLSTSTAVPRD